MAGVRIHPLNQLTARSLSSDESILVVSEDASAEDAALVREAIGAGAVDADALITAAESMTTEQEGEMRDALAIGDALVVPAGLVADAKLFEQAIWSGEAAVALGPRSKFSQAVASWLQLTKTNTEVIPIKPGKQHGLKRLQQAS
jgi:hypothetical protein